MKNTIAFLVLACLLQTSSCVEKSRDPVRALQSYIDYRFSKNQSKEKLLSKTRGELYAELERFSEEELSNLVNPRKYRRGSFKVNLKKCNDTRCHITYTLKFDQKDNNQKKSFRVITKKIAQLDFEEETWKIAKITEIKTYFEAKNSLDVTSPGKTENPFK